MRKSIFVVLTVLFMVVGVMAQTVPPVPAPEVGVKGSNEVMAGVGQMFFTDTTAQKYTVDAANFTADIGFRHWISDHATLGFSFYHDTVKLASLTTSLPIGSHYIWGLDFTATYTLKLYDQGITPDVPTNWMEWLNNHTKRVGVSSIGGAGVIVIDNVKTLTYFIGIESAYWIDEKMSVKLQTDMRHATIMGAQKTYPEVKLLLAYRF